MNVVLSTSDRNICGICLGEFEREEEKWTHEGEGGMTHDPFHKHCLKDWLQRNPRCPLDRTPINPDSLLSRTDRIFRRAHTVLVNSVCAASLGAVAGASGISAGISTAIGVAAPRVLAAAGPAGVGILAAAGVPAITEPAEALIGVAVGTDVSILFEHLGMSQNDQINVGAGVYLGSVTAGLMGSGRGVLPTLATISLASGIFSGLSTLMRR